MSQAQVTFPDVLVVVAQVVGVPLVFQAVEVGQLAGGRDLDVHVIGCAAQHAVAGLGDDLHGPSAAHQVFLRLRHEIGQGNRLSAGGRLKSHPVAVLRPVLEVVDSGEGRCHAGGLGVGGHIVHPFALQPDLPAVSQTFQEFFTRTYRHVFLRPLMAVYL